MFEWDKNKDRLNQEKHGIAFSDTFAVFEDPNALTLADNEHNEERYVTGHGLFRQDPDCGIYLARRNHPNHIRKKSDQTRGEAV